MKLDYSREHSSFVCTTIKKNSKPFERHQCDFINIYYQEHDYFVCMHLNTIADEEVKSGKVEKELNNK